MNMKTPFYCEGSLKIAREKKDRLHEILYRHHPGRDLWFVNRDVLLCGITPFELSCQYGRLEWIKVMINTGISGPLMAKGLRLACKHNQREVVDWLLDTEIFNHQPSLDEGLLGAVEGEHLPIVKLLVEKGASNFDEAIKGSCKNREIPKFLNEKRREQRGKLRPEPRVGVHTSFIPENPEEEDGQSDASNEAEEGAPAVV